jgi:hypothetical protein
MFREFHISSGSLNSLFGKYHSYCKYSLLLIIFVIIFSIVYSFISKIYFVVFNSFVMVLSLCPLWVNVAHFCFIFFLLIVFYHFFGFYGSVNIYISYKNYFAFYISAFFAVFIKGIYVICPLDTWYQLLCAHVDDMGCSELEFLLMCFSYTLCNVIYYFFDIWLNRGNLVSFYLFPTVNLTAGCTVLNSVSVVFICVTFS